MKFFHISDLHIGKRVNGFSMLEDQKYILSSILKLVRENRPDGVWIAGDLYDKSMPSAEAVETADWFLSQLAAQNVPAWVISGNHDSAERVAYAGKMLEQAGVYVSRIFDGKMQGYCVQKKRGGKVSVVPMKPFSETAILTGNEAEPKKKISAANDVQTWAHVPQVCADEERKNGSISGCCRICVLRRFAVFFRRTRLKQRSRLLRLC